MADYFTHFSCLLDVGTADNAKAALELHQAFVNNAIRNNERPDGFRLSIHPQGGETQLWVRDDLGGDPLQVIAFVRDCAETFGLSGRWGFQFANTCSRPNINAFGGGAYVLDLASLKTIGRSDTGQWLARLLARSGNKQVAP